VQPWNPTFPSALPRFVSPSGTFCVLCQQPALPAVVPWFVSPCGTFCVLCQQPALPAVVPQFVPSSIFFSLLPVLPLFVSYLIFVLTAFLIVGLAVVREQPLHCHCHGHFVVLHVSLVARLWTFSCAMQRFVLALQWGSVILT